MKILGISFGTKNGNNDTMCRVGLEACKNAGAEIEFIHAFDWDLRPCTGCVACSRGLTMGKGMVCSVKDDFKAFYEKMIEADGILIVDPIFENGASGYFHNVLDRMGPGHDTGLMKMADEKLKAEGREGLNPRYFKQKPISFVGIGGSDWALRVQTDHAMLAMTPGWKIIDNDFFSWSKDVIMQDDKIARMQEIGKNLAEAAKYIMDQDMDVIGSDDIKLWKGKEGTCPHCQCNNFHVDPETGVVTCELCGLEGELKTVDGKLRFVFDPANEYKAHDIMSGKGLHGDDVLHNEMRLMGLAKDEEFKKRKAYYTEICAPTPAPEK
ncbi:MAG: NAD(P)H-dependent oxidoreductase [Parasporobacterium sp.]|nr:NAD(P)H-dependent oxidoreductase [Parasporobacterium sp.]